MITRSDSRQPIPLNRKDLEALHALDRLHLKPITIWMRSLFSIYRLIQNIGNGIGIHAARRLNVANLVANFYEALSILVVEVPDRPPRMHYLPMTYDSMAVHLNALGLECSVRFRFQSKL